jgi:hypothetical protein
MKTRRGCSHNPFSHFAPLSRLEALITFLRKQNVHTHLKGRKNYHQFQTHVLYWTNNCRLHTHFFLSRTHGCRNTSHKLPPRINSSRTRHILTVSLQFTSGDTRNCRRSHTATHSAKWWARCAAGQVCSSWCKRWATMNEGCTTETFEWTRGLNGRGVYTEGKQNKNDQPLQWWRYDLDDREVWFKFPARSGMFLCGAHQPPPLFCKMALQPQWA